MLNLSIGELVIKIPEIGKWLNTCTKNNANTKLKYETDILNFCRVLNLDSLKSINDLEVEDFDNFTDILQSNSLANSTIKNRVDNIKRLIRWLKRKDFILNDVTDDIRILKVNHEFQFTMEIEDKDSLIESISSHSKKTRQLLMVELFLETALRKSEVVNLKISDINEDSLRIFGKGGKIVNQAVSDLLIKKLRAYIETERKENIDKYILMGGTDLDYVFVSGIGDINNYAKKQKNLTNGNQVSANSFANSLKMFARKADIKEWKKIKPHGLRRLAVTCVYDQTKDPLVTKEFARHESFETTAKNYIRPHHKELRRVANECTPNSIKAVKDEPIKSERELELEKQLAEMQEMIKSLGGNK